MYSDEELNEMSIAEELADRQKHDDKLKELAEEQRKREIAENLDAELGEVLDCDDTALLETWAFELNI